MTTLYSDAEAAELYDRLNPWGPSDDFYLRHVMAAASAVDVGCGTGALLRRAREAGHHGVLVGVDPDDAALAIARRRADVEWVTAVAADMPWVSRFSLATMTGHAFQTLVTEDDVHDSLRAIRRALQPGGTFAFETRNPHAKAWETWAAMQPIAVVDASGRDLRITYAILDVSGGVVTFTETTRDATLRPLRVDQARLRFLSATEVTRSLEATGFTVEAQYGFWDMRPAGADAPEIVTIARAADAHRP